MIAVVLPSKDRPDFLSHAKYLLSLQTRQPDIVIVVDEPTDMYCDITYRYRVGVERALQSGAEVIIFWEDDDYYRSNYIENMIMRWERAGKPDIFGHNTTIYYNVKFKKWNKLKHDGRASMCNTMVSSVGAKKITWCDDSEPFTDMHLWRILQGHSTSEQPDCIGIKHGNGTTVTHSHHEEKQYMFDDDDFTFLENNVKDKISLNFYKSFSKPKLTAIYNVYNGIELLRGSIRQILPVIDELIIVYQNKSNWGEEKDTRQEVIEALSGLPIDMKLVKYEPEKNLTPKQNETRKRNKGLKHVKSNYFICMDCDEYYDTKQFKKAFEYIYKNKIDSSLCRLYTYLKSPEKRLKEFEDYYVPFIMKKYKDTELGKFPMVKLVDPSRGVNTQKKCYIFEPHELVMHHYTWTRTEKEIRNKFMNASARTNWVNRVDELMNDWNNSCFNYFLGGRLKTDNEVITVDNFFKISL